MELPIRTASFDICYSSNVLEHVADPAHGRRDGAGDPARRPRLHLLHRVVPPWGGHGRSPWHYLGGDRARPPLPSAARAAPKNRFGESMLAVTVRAVASWAAPATGAELVNAAPALPPRLAPAGLKACPGLREVLSWNLGASCSVGDDGPAAPAQPPDPHRRSVTWGLCRFVCWPWAAGGSRSSQAPGRIVSDTKKDLIADPGASWPGRCTCGTRRWLRAGADQAYGYLFPMGPFFGLGDLASAPGMGGPARLVVAAARRRVPRRRQAVRGDGLGHPGRPAGGRIRVRPLTAHPQHPRPHLDRGVAMALAPWVLVPLVLGSRRGSPVRAAALSALAVAAVGGVNAAATSAVLPLGVVWLLTRTPDRADVPCWCGGPSSSGWARCGGWCRCSSSGGYSPPFLDFIETAAVTTFPTTPFDVLRGTSHWVPYVDATWQAGNDLLTTGYVAVNGAVLLVLGLVGLSLRSNPHRRVLVLGLLSGLVLVSLGHSGAVDRWFAGVERTALDGALAPLRNVHKFDPVLRLPLVLGLAPRARCGASGLPLGPRAVVEWRSRLEDGQRVASVGLVVLASVAVGRRGQPRAGGPALPDAGLPGRARLLAAGGVVAGPAGNRRPRDGAARAGIQLRDLPVGHAGGRAAAVLRRVGLGGAQRRAARAAGQHPDARRGGAAARHRSAVRWARSVPRPGRHRPAGGAQRPAPDRRRTPPGPGAPGARGLAGHRAGRRLRS